MFCLSISNFLLNSISFSGAPQKDNSNSSPILFKPVTYFLSTLNGNLKIGIFFLSKEGFKIPLSAAPRIKALSVDDPSIFHFLKSSRGFSINDCAAIIPTFKANFSSLAKISPNSIFPFVKVLVLSMQITDALPNVSTEAKRRTNPFFFKILSIPTAKITVITIGKASGIPPTATAIDVSNISIQFCPLIIPTRKIKKQITPITMLIVLLSSNNFF